MIDEMMMVMDRITHWLNFLEEDSAISANRFGSLSLRFWGVICVDIFGLKAKSKKAGNSS